MEFRRAQVAETSYTAFGSRSGPKVTARPSVRGIKRLNPKTVPSGQIQGFAAWPACAVMAHHRSRAAAFPADGNPGKTRSAATCVRLINILVPASYTARIYTLRLPATSTSDPRFSAMFTAARASPTLA